MQEIAKTHYSSSDAAEESRLVVRSHHALSSSPLHRVGGRKTHWFFLKLRSSSDTLLLFEHLTRNRPRPNPATLTRWLEPQSGVGGNGLVIVEAPYDPNIDFHLTAFNLKGEATEVLPQHVRGATTFIYELGFSTKPQLCLSSTTAQFHSTLGARKGAAIIHPLPTLLPQSAPVQHEGIVAQGAAQGCSFILFKGSAHHLKALLTQIHDQPLFVAELLDTTQIKLHTPINSPLDDERSALHAFALGQQHQKLGPRITSGELRMELIGTEVHLSYPTVICAEGWLSTS